MTTDPGFQPAPPDAGPAVSLAGLTLRAGRRTIFEDVTFDVAPGSLAVLSGASGTGKTALALAVAGRLVPTAGRATVLGHVLPRQSGAVRRLVGIAGNATVAPLDETLTVRHHVVEALKLAGPWWRPSASRARIDRTITAANELVGALEGAFGDGTAAAPLVQARLHRNRLVRDASPVERFALALVLALVPAPAILVVDDVDQLRTREERRAAWAALLTLEGARRSDSGPLTVIATCQDPRELDDVLAAEHRLGVFPLRPVQVHSLDAAAGDDAAHVPAPASPEEIR